MEALTLERAKEIAADVVAEFGEEYVYPKEHKVKFPGSEEPSCVYVHEGKPSCLVGQILHRHGVSTAELSLWENRGAFAVAYNTANGEEKALRFLSCLQSRQDNGCTWGVALSEANHLYPA